MAYCPSQEIYWSHEDEAQKDLFWTFSMLEPMSPIEYRDLRYFGGYLIWGHETSDSGLTWITGFIVFRTIKSLRGVLQLIPGAFWEPMHMSMTCGASRQNIRDVCYDVTEWGRIPNDNILEEESEEDVGGGGNN